MGSRRQVVDYERQTHGKSGMTENIEHLILEHLRSLRAVMDPSGSL